MKNLLFESLILSRKPFKVNPFIGLLFALLLFTVLNAFGQETKSQLTTRFDVIRNETAVGGNTKTRIANAYQELADGSIGVFPVTASGTDTYTGSLVGIDAYSGRIVFVVFPNNNTGSSTFNLNSIGATQIRKYESGWVVLEADDIIAGKLYRLYNDGTYWQIDLGGSGGGAGTPGGSDTQVQFNDGGTFNGEAEFTYNKTDNVVKIHKLAGDATDGLIVESSGGTDIGILGAGNTANVTWYGSHNFDAATANTIASFGASKTLSSLSTATYPSLTELSYIKGVTSAAQDQFDAKANEALTIDTKTDDYTLVLTDKDSKLIEMNDATGNDVTVPLNSSVAFPVGTTITIVQKNTEQTTIVATGGVTINSSAGTLDGPGQNAPMVLAKIGTDTWYLWNGTAASGGGTWGSITGTLSDQTDLQSALDAKVPTTRTISTTSPLSGGGDLSANRTLTIADAAADATTKGAATFTAADFNSSSGNISIDYTNGQAASESVKGFAELATQAETDAFTDDVRAVTPLKLHTNLKRRSTKTANFAIAAADAGATLDANSSTVITCTVDALSTGDQVFITNRGTANVNFSAGSGVSISGLSALKPGFACVIDYNAGTSATIYGGDASQSGMTVLYNNFSSVSNSGSTETDLFSYTLPAGTLSTNGETVEGIVAGTFAATANNKTLRVKLGATTVFTSGSLAITSATDWSLSYVLIRVSDTSQKFIGTLSLSNSTTQSFTDYSTAAETLSVSNIINVTGQGTASSDITAEFTKIKKGGF